MYMAEFVERMKGIRICPVLVIEDKNDAIPLGKALLEGKLPVAEVTFRTAAAKESIALMVKEYPDLYVGAGTVITLQQCKDAVEAGAKFIVSPSFSHEVAAFCREREIPYCPGVLTESPEFLLTCVDYGWQIKSALFSPFTIVLVKIGFHHTVVKLSVFIRLPKVFLRLLVSGD